MSVTTISSTEFAKLCQKSKDVEIIDVRTPVEYREVHIEGAKNVPLDRLDPAALMKGRNGTSSDPLYLICKSGGRGKQACEKFNQAGFSNVINVEGGTTACVAAGIPAVRGQKAMSLERQVRIAAGSLVLTGVILGFLVHPVLFGLSGFVGAGLIFAGITDTCGMGMVLAKMPWNQCRDSGAACATK